MPLTLKKDVWNVRDPASGSYRGAAILSTTLPEDAAQIIEDTEDALDVQELRAEEIINDAQRAISGIDGERSRILESIASIAGQGTDSTLSTAGVAADAAACGALKNILECNQSTDGTYILKCTILNGVATYTWQLET